MSKKQQVLVKVIVTAVFAAIAMVINRFLSFNVWNVSIGVSFIPIMVCAMTLGPVWGGACGALADFVGATLFPFGPYFPGFTAVAFLSGLIYGLPEAIRPTEKLPYFVLRMGLAVLVEQIVCSLLLNTLWISLLYGSPFIPTMLSRIPKCAIMLVAETAIAILIKLSVVSPVKKVLKGS